MVVSNIFYFHPYFGKWPHLTNIFQMGWNPTRAPWEDGGHFQFPPKWQIGSFWSWNHLRRSGRNSALVAIPSPRGLVPWQYVDCMFCHRLGQKISGIYIYINIYIYRLNEIFLVSCSLLIANVFVKLGNKKLVWCISRQFCLLLSPRKQKRYELCLEPFWQKFDRNLSFKNSKTAVVWLVNWPLTYVDFSLDM